MMYQWLVKQRKLLVISLVSFYIICGLFVWLWQRAKQAEKSYQNAMLLEQGQMERADFLEKELHISKLNAGQLQAAYEKEKRKPPAASFTVQAPTLDVAAEQVVERIDAGDKSLPPATMEKTERTVVVKDTQAYKVEVLKINLDKAWEISTGIGSHQGNTYLPLGVQRNYSTHKAVAAELHLVPEELARGKIKTSGWEVKHVWRF